MNVLVTKPRALSAEDKAILREAGIVCVEAKNPDDVRLLNVEGAPIEANDMFWAALMAIAKKTEGQTGTCDLFVRQLAALNKAK